MRKTTLFLALCIGAASACSDTTTGSISNTPLTADTFAPAYHRAFCDSLFRCPTIGDTGSLVALLETPSTCAMRVTTAAAATIADVFSLVRGGTIRFDGMAAAECLARIGQTCSQSDSDLASLCRRTFIGTVAAYSPCWRSEECAPGNFCNTGLRTCPGICQAQRGIGVHCILDRECQGWNEGTAGCVGDVCAAITDGAAGVEGQRCGTIPGSPATRVACMTGLACVSQMCRRVVAAGAPCTTSDACAAGTVCAPTAGTTTRTCAAPSSLVRSTPGGTCSADGRTAPLCNPLAHLECNAMNTCATLGDGSMGSRCIPGNDLLAATCNDGLRCDRTSRTCVPRAATGAACTSNSDCLSNECEGDRCLAHVCE